MKNVLIIIYLIHSIHAKLTPTNKCQNCLGKLHTKEDLELTKQPLILNKKQICQNKKYQFLIIVKSGNFQRRNLTRYTWAKEMIEHFNIPVLYAIGYSTNFSTQKEIQKENQIYNDLLEFNILENYYNLTIKTTSVLLWYDQYCSKNSNYLLYVDDDVLIHAEKLIMYINNIKNNNIIEGWFEKSGKIQRQGIGGISKEIFPIDIVPDYLWGAAVLYPSNIISNILINSIFNTTLPIFFRDDVFINGFIAEEARIKRRYMQGILLYDHTEDDLKSNMIIIDFNTEENREKAWNCYKYHIQCNKNLTLLLLKIFCGIFLSIIILVSCWKCFKTTSCYYQLKHELNLWYYGLNYSYKKHINSELMMKRKQRSTVGTKLGIQWLINFRRMSIKIVFVFVIIIVLYYTVKNK